MFMLGAGAAHVWGQIAFVAVGGFWLIFRPPQSTPHRFLNIGCIALLTWTLLQLLPGLAQDSFWRENLAVVGLLEQPTRPAISAWGQWMALVWLMAAIGWIFTAIEHMSQLGRTPRRDSLKVFAVMMAAAGFVCFAMNAGGYDNPLVRDSHVFSLLPNRNHTALLCSLGGVACFALGCEGMARHPWRTALFLLGTVSCFLGVLSLTSRAALFLLLLGMGMWMLFSARQDYTRQRFKILIPFVFLLLAVLFAVGQVTASRIFTFLGEAELARDAEGRLGIYADTFHMMPTVWISGSGWGSFETVFPFFREESLNSLAILHPESDWLWLLAEGGIMALLAVLVAVVGLVGAILATGQRMERARRIAVLCLCLAAIHGVVDVPLHNPSVFLFLAGLLGLALPPPEKDFSCALWLPPLGWRVVGGLLIAVAGFQLFGEMTGRPWSKTTVTATGIALLQHEGQAEFQSPDAHSAWLNEAVSRFPFVWSLHTNQARDLLEAGKGGDARDAFRRARAAQADQGVVTLVEARLWESRAVGPALDAYRATFLKRDFFDRQAQFKSALNRTRTQPALHAGLARISREDVGLRAIFFEVASEPLLRQEMENELRHYPTLARWPAVERDRLWWHLARVLGWVRVAEHFHRFPDNARQSPLIAAVAAEESTGWESGGARLQALLPVPQFTAYGRDYSASQLEVGYRRSPQDVALALAFLRSQVEAQTWERVLEVTAEFRPRDRARYPSSMHYWHARALAELGRPHEAARPWRAYVKLLIDRGDVVSLDDES